MTQILKSVVVALAIFATLFGIGWATISLMTSDSRLLSASRLALASASPSSSSPVNSGVSGANSDVLDAGPAVGPQGSSQMNQQGLDRQQIKSILTELLGKAALGGLVCTVLWFGLAAWKEKDAVGVTGQRSASAFWLLCLLAMEAAIIALAWSAWSGQLSILVDPSFRFPGGLAIMAAMTAGFWLSTALGTSDVMRPSLPGAFALPSL